MKKLMLSAVALMIASAGFAQANDPVTDTSGDTSPDPKVILALPGAPAGANTGLSIQNGNNNKVRVRQAGTSQSTYTHQDDGSGTGGNLASIIQTGAVSGASGVENIADVRQSGTANQSRTIQEGDLNEAITRQGRNGNDASSGNRAWIRQGIGQQAEENYATIDQDGDNNHAATRQIYDNSDSWTQQVGDDNRSRILQDAGPNGTDGHYAMNEQLGDRNESYVTQSGAGARNTATMSQKGDDNEGKQIQTTDALMGSVGNRAGMQQGLLNLSYSLNPLISPGGLFSTVGPLDPVNIFFGVSGLESHNGVGFQIQSGHENAADMIQVSGLAAETNYGEQNQSGHHNEAAMLQSHFPGDKNYARQDQDGHANKAALAQTGSGFKSWSTQIGSGNSVLSSQRGEGHLLNVHQRGADSYATTAQAGKDNKALVVQYDGQSYSVEQNLDLPTLFDVSAGGNQADILQLGPNGDFANDAIDCDFENELPTMDWNLGSFAIGDICPGC